MAQTIKIKRSTGSTAPSSLSGGELAFTGGAGTYADGGQRLYIGDPANSDAVTVIGGNYFTTMLDHQPGTLTGSSAIIVDSNSKVDILKAGNIVVTGSTDTISTASGNLTLAPTGNLVITHGGTVSLATQATSLTVKDNEANALDINEGGTSYFKVTTTDGSEKVTVGKELAVAETISAAAGMTLAPVGNLTITHGGVVSLAGQATSLTIPDNEASALDINEGGNSYLNFVTTNGAEKVVVGKELRVAGTVSAAGALTLAPVGNLVVTHGGTIDLSAQANSISVKDNTVNAFDINEGGTSYIKVTTTDSGEKVVIGKELQADAALRLKSDNVNLYFGADSEVSFTHVPDTGLLLNSSSELQFRDSALKVYSSADGQLDIAADTELAITAPTVDIDAATEVNISNALTVGGAVDVGTGSFTVSAAGAVYAASTLEADGATTLNDTLGVTGAATFNGAVTLGNASDDAILVKGTATFEQSADFDGGFTVAGSQTIDMGTNRVTNVGTPTQSTDAATKSYVDSVKQALDIKDSVRAATTADLSATYNNGTAGVGATLTADSNGAISVDDISPGQGDRILVKDQDTASENGIYTVTTVGDGSTAFVLTRATDADSAAEVTGGLFTFVEEGTIGADNAYVLTSITGSATLGTSTLTFTQFSGAGQIIAGQALSKDGNTLDVEVDGKSIEVNSDALRLKGITGTANGDLLYGANGTNGGYAALSIGTYDATNSVGQILQVGAGSTVTWTNTIDGGTFS